MNQRCLIIAEAGVNHNGRLDLALELCDAAKDAGADVVKFQTWHTPDIITRTVDQASYQARNTGKRESQFDMLQRLELPRAAFVEIKAHCDRLGIAFASTADDADSLGFLAGLGVPFAKIGSGDIANVPYLRRAGAFGLPVLLSTGMSTLGDVDLSIAALRDGNPDVDITLLHCTTNYPCPFEEANLTAMATLGRAFGLPVGYSDHTLGTEAAVAAVALGARVIEKHFTLDRGMEGPDHAASTEPEEFRRLVREIRNVEKALGDGLKRPTASERDIAAVVTKRVVAAREIRAGETLSESNLAVKRAEAGAPARYWDWVVGRPAARGYRPDEGVGLGAV